MKVRIGKALLWLAAAMYLIIGIGLYQSAYADEGTDDPMMLGYWQGMYYGDSRINRAHASYQVANMLMSASYGMAQEDPGRYGEFDASYLNDRAASIRSCVPNMSIEDTAGFFFGWTRRMKLRGGVWIGAAVSLFLDTCYKAENPEMES